MSTEMEAIGKMADGGAKDIFEAFAGKNDITVAHDSHARALQDADSLAIKVRSCFEDLLRSQEQLGKVGSEVQDTLPYPLNEAWAEWRLKEKSKEAIAETNKLLAS